MVAANLVLFLQLMVSWFAAVFVFFSISMSNPYRDYSGESAYAGFSFLGPVVAFLLGWAGAGTALGLRRGTAAAWIFGVIAYGWVFLWTAVTVQGLRS